MRLAPGIRLVLIVTVLLTVATTDRALAQSGAPIDTRSLGITVDSATLMPTPDPVYEIDLKLSLHAGYTLQFGDYINILAINYASGFTRVVAPNFWAASDSTDGMIPGTTDFRFTYVDRPTITAGPGPIALGDFVVETTIPFVPGQPIPPQVQQLASTQLNYNSLTQLNGVDSYNGGTITPSIGVVPEPASLVQLAFGLVAVLGGLGHHRVRSRAVRSVNRSGR